MNDEEYKNELGKNTSKESVLKIIEKMGWKNYFFFYFFILFFKSNFKKLKNTFFFFVKVIFLLKKYFNYNVRSLEF